MNYFELFQLASPETIVVITALAVLALSFAAGRKNEASSQSPADFLLILVTCFGLILAVCAVLRLPTNAVRFGGMLVISPLTSLFKIICLVLSFFTVALSNGEKSLRNQGEYLALLLLATIGLMLLVGSEELLMIFIGLELTGLCLYVLTAFDKTALRSAEAGLKYFLFGSTASAFTLFGLSLVYGMSGTTNLTAIAHHIISTTAPPLLAAGVVMTLIGFAFKVAAAPFHLWAPDTYQGAPASSAAFIASGSKVASFFVLGKIVLVGFAPLSGSADWHRMTAGWIPVLAALSALSIVIGNLAALVQSNVRRLLAYSAVAHAGYTLLGLVAGRGFGFRAALFYITVYAFTLIGAFGVVALVRRQTGGDDLRNFAGLRARSPLLAACMAVFLLSLAGLPPLAGFFGKFYLFSVAFSSGSNHGLLWLVALALFGSLISLYYYLIVLKAIFVDESPADASVARVTFIEGLSLSLLALLVLFLGLAPHLLVDRIAS